MNNDTSTLDPAVVNDHLTNWTATGWLGGIALLLAAGLLGAAAKVDPQQRAQMITDALSALTAEEREDLQAAAKELEEVKKHFGVTSFRACQRGNYDSSSTIPTAAALREEANMLRLLCDAAGMGPGERADEETAVDVPGAR